MMKWKGIYRALQIKMKREEWDQRLIDSNEESLIRRDDERTRDSSIKW